MQNSQMVKNSLWETPETWSWTTLSDIADWKSGGTPLSSEKRYYGGDIPWLIIGDLNDGVVTSAQKSITQLGLDNSSVKRVKKGAILIAMYGSIGKLGIAGIDCSTNQAIAFTNTISKEVSDKYLFYYLMHLRGYLFTQGKGGAQQNISLTVLNASPFVKPPFEEQIRLVSKIETSLQLVNQSNINIEKGKKLIQKFRQSVLSAGVTGRLTEEWRKRNPVIESGYDLLARVKNERHTKYQDILNSAKKENKSKPRKLYSEDFPVIKLEEIEETIPENWTFTNVGFLAFVTKLAGFEYTKYIKLSDEGEIPVIRAQNVQMGRFVEENIKYISKETSDILDRSQLHGREILMVFIGAGTGNVCLAPRGKQWHLAPNVAKIDVDGIDVNYLFYYLQSPIGFHHTMSWMKATAQPSLSMQTIRQIVVSVPPLEEQREIVRRITLILEDADLVEKEVETAGNKADKLTQSILAKAFRGELN